VRGNSRDLRLPMLPFKFCMLKLNHSSPKTKNGRQQIFDFFFSDVDHWPPGVYVAKAVTMLLFGSKNFNHGCTWIDTDAQNAGEGMLMRIYRGRRSKRSGQFRTVVG